MATATVRIIWQVFSMFILIILHRNRLSTFM